MGIGLFQAAQMFLGLAVLVAYSHIIDALQPQPFLPDGYRQPHRPLIVFKPVSTNPGGTPGELNGIENYKHIAQVCLVEKTGERSKIWPAGGKDHLNSISR